MTPNNAIPDMITAECRGEYDDNKLHCNHSQKKSVSMMAGALNSAFMSAPLPAVAQPDNQTTRQPYNQTSKQARAMRSESP